MTIAEASWEDPSGILQTAPARMENKSANGACIRVKTLIGVGSKLSVQWRWEQFSGVAKYCRSDWWDYRVGIQRDASYDPFPNRPLAKHIPLPQAASARVANAEVASVGLAVARVATTEVGAAGVKSISPLVSPTVLPPRIARPPQPQESQAKRSESRQSVEATPVIVARGLAATAPSRIDPEVGGHPKRRVSQPQNLDALRAMEPPTKHPAKGKQAGNERKRMERNWLGLPHWNSKQEASSASGNGNSNGAASPAEKLSAGAGTGAAAFEVDLLPMEDIYRAAGIMNPPKGYGIQKVVDMLHSEHIRALSREMKRAAVLMALDAAGIPIDQLQRDVRMRQEALDSYEEEQKKQVEAEWARKAEENIQIAAELERTTAHHKSRIARNLEAVAREKETFDGWLITKRQEMQYMAEAAELCLKSPSHETANPSLAEPSKREAKPNVNPIEVTKPETSKVNATSASTNRRDAMNTDALKADAIKIDGIKADTNTQPVPDPAKLLLPEVSMAKVAGAGKPT
jgi:hypothetical protein